MKHASHSNHRLNRFVVKLLAGCIAGSIMLAGPVFASGETSIPVVGEVSLVLGKAYVEKPNGARELITVGTSINVNDRVETGSNGHVHIRFVDQALVSIRPSSQLEILRYDYNAAAPQDSVVKLNLVEGVTRAISGKAAKAARENFRMDTPIAAIGVRGTDFVVSSNHDGVLAQVNEGAIIIAPYSTECSAAAFGPCSLNALEVIGGANQIAQINANTNEALLLSLSSPLVPEVLVEPSQSPASASAVASLETKTKDEGLYTDSVTSKAVTLALPRNGTPVAPLPLIPKVPEFTPSAIASAQSLTSNQLVWGRWSEGSSTLERITLFRDTVTDNRHTTVGNFVYSLYRTNTDSDQVQPSLPVLGFNLKQAQAILTSNGQSDLMNVTGGLLNIDFNQNLFSTSLQMNHAATGNVEFRENGRVFDDGIFRSSNVGINGFSTIAGAVSLDGKEAGYFFEKIVEAGIIEGLTLWGVKP